MPTDQDRDQRDEDERDDEERDEEAGERAEAEADKPDPNAPRNRAERRALAKAARRGKPAPLLADPTKTEADEVEPLGEVGSGVAPAAPSLVAKRPRVPPRTMSKGTGDVEGVPEWARRAGDYLGQHRRTLAAGALAVVAVVGGALGFQAYRGRAEARASAAYGEALEVFRAPVQAEDAPQPPGAPPQRGPRYRTWEERARAAVDKFRRVEQRFPSSRVAPLAKLGEASTLYQLGRYAEAKQLYLQLLGADVAGLEARVLEGLAFTMESMNDLDGAMQRYRELQNIDDGEHRDRAQYYQARLLTRQNNNARAKELLHGVVDRVGRASSSDPAAASSLALRDQAIALLRDIDPADPAVVARDRENETSGHGHEGGPPGGMQNLPPEIQNLIRQMQTKQGPGGARPGGPGGPGGGGGGGQ